MNIPMGKTDFVVLVDKILEHIPPFTLFLYEGNRIKYCIEFIPTLQQIIRQQLCYSQHTKVYHFL